MRTRRHRTGALCDHGAAYIHGTVGNPLAELAKEAGIGLKQVSTTFFGRSARLAASVRERGGGGGHEEHQAGGERSKTKIVFPINGLLIVVAV